MNHLDGTDSAQSVFPEWKSFLGTSSDEEAKSFIKKVVKRSGEIESYDRKKIEKAIGKAITAVEKMANPEKAERLTDAVEEQLRLLLAGRRAHSIPAIEEIQDVVETPHDNSSYAGFLLSFSSVMASLGVPIQDR